MCPLHLPSVLTALALALPGPSAAQADPREPVLLPQAEQPAWNAIGRVNIAGLRRRGMCTGTLIAPDLVLTAAHCLYRGDGRPARTEDIHFIAGWRAGGYAAHGTAAEVHIDPDFVYDPTPSPSQVAADTGILVLTEPLDTIDPLPSTALPDPAPELAVIGYRMDRPHAPSRQTACQVTYRGPAEIGLDCAVVSGASGAPVLWNSPAGWRVVGVVASSVSGPGPVKALAPLVGAKGRLPPF